ncbi:MAG: hypothetical protein H7Y42_18495 [Chitinophagaceae bacterium]|nr:hypothetical protein [Chitinophagaceae bacterium]
MIRFFCVATLILIILSCNDNTTTTGSTTVTDSLSGKAVAGKDTTIGGCYSQLYNRDTAMLQIDMSGTNVTGPLSYKIFEKDMNDGSIKAELTDSIITGWYLFRSEGVMSVRQVAWRVRPGELWPASGDVTQRNDTTMFTDPANLQFDSNRPFVKIKCTL